MFAFSQYLFYVSKILVKLNVIWKILEAIRRKNECQRFLQQADNSKQLQWLILSSLCHTIDIVSYNQQVAYYRKVLAKTRMLHWEQKHKLNFKTICNRKAVSESKHQ